VQVNRLDVQCRLSGTSGPLSKKWEPVHRITGKIISLILGMSMRKEQELTIITKTYDLILWSCNHTSRFPRNHRFVLGERIERNLYTLLETLIRAKYNKSRQRLLEESNLTLEILRFQMRLAKDLQCLKVESYGFASKAIDEIGRLVGGWLRSRADGADA
jgi:23S rRNA-intervening sequence protein